MNRTLTIVSNARRFGALHDAHSVRAIANDRRPVRARPVVVSQSKPARGTLQASWHVCPLTERLECRWSLGESHDQPQSMRMRMIMRGWRCDVATQGRRAAWRSDRRS